MISVCMVANTVGLSMMCREVFGKRGFGVVYPVAALGCSFSNAVFSSAVGYGYDLTGGYAVSLVAFLVFLVGSAAVVLWCYVRPDEKAVYMLGTAVCQGSQAHGLTPIEENGSRRSNSTSVIFNA